MGPIIDFEDKIKVFVIIVTIFVLMFLVSSGIYYWIESDECIECTKCVPCECPQEFYFIENYSKQGNVFYADIDDFQCLFLIGNNLLVRCLE